MNLRPNLYPLSNSGLSLFVNAPNRHPAEDLDELETRARLYYRKFGKSLLESALPRDKTQTPDRWLAVTDTHASAEMIEFILMYTSSVRFDETRVKDVLEEMAEGIGQAEDLAA